MDQHLPDGQSALQNGDRGDLHTETSQSDSTINRSSNVP